MSKGDTWYVQVGRICYGPTDNYAKATRLSNGEAGGCVTDHLDEGVTVVGLDKLATIPKADADGVIAILDMPVTLASSAFELTPTGLTITGKPTVDQWISFGRFLKTAHKSILFAIGDWILYGKDRADWGEQYDQAVDVLGMDYEYLCNIVSVCKNVTNPRRHEKLSFSHHAEVSHLQPAQQEKMLERAEKEDLSSHELREEVRIETGHSPYQHELDRFEGNFDQAIHWLADMKFKHGWQKRIRIVILEA